MRRFKGFTLTELMIALAVLGILVAVVTPAIMRARPNKNKMMVKKTFYTVENIVSSLINDETIYPDLRSNCGDDETGADPVHTPCAWGFDYTGLVRSEGEPYGAGDADNWDNASNPTTDAAKNKFALLFGSRLNSKIDAESTTTTFVTNDGARWYLGGTVGAWEPNKEKVGDFTQCATAATDSAGCGVIKINVESDASEVACTQTNSQDCNTYEIQLLANGKLRINPNHVTAKNWVNINTSIKN